MILEHEYIRSELRGRFKELQDRHGSLIRRLKNGDLSSTEDLLKLQTRLEPELEYVQNGIESVLLQLEAFEQTAEEQWGRLRETTEAEWNRLSEILDDVEQTLRYEEDAAQLPDGRNPRDMQGRVYSVSGRR